MNIVFFLNYVFFFVLLFLRLFLGVLLFIVLCGGSLMLPSSSGLDQRKEIKRADSLLVGNVYTVGL